MTSASGFSYAMAVAAAQSWFFCQNYIHALQSDITDCETTYNDHKEAAEDLRKTEEHIGHDRPEF